ncbi:aryl-alcohol dehydrogenase-like predicted oxidoreductase [Pseudoduganella flava]|uniref:Aldo/keto reductase n=1 Tax=Pseudoduganella flava TaxID=871742 RepID=A0A562PSF5_9BURK|nr:aldo/keto reductase [Pseudoduganella flava]QGZ39312.1 aldo/keto reductase [Pseudoduganella flava]TWI47381.1 aryl-alcohol dehydrogenase-like predicted oxidoreductase [Pseudoduganella flava]
MDKIKLGRTDVDVTRICLGTMTWGRQNSESDAHSQLDYALERGINFIDTAEMYPVMPSPETQGSTERYIGTWLKKTGRRADVVLATKAAGPNPNIHWIRGGAQDFDEKNLRAAVETSLARLQTDYIDLYQLHWPSRNVPIFGAQAFDPAKERASVAIEDTLAALGKLVDEGKIRHIGVSNESSWGVCEFVKQAEMKGLPRIATIQNLYNLTARHYETSFLDETCMREDVSLLAYSPLAFGQLTAKYLDDPQAHGRLTIYPPTWSPRYLRPGVLAAVARYAKLARDNGMTPAQMALAWCYSRWFVASTIIGATTLAQLRENIDAYTVKLPRHVLEEIDAIHASLPNPGQ